MTVDTYVEFAQFIALVLTLWAAIRMLDLHTRPQVECHLRSRPDKPNVFELVVGNYGQGAAKNLEIELIDVEEEDFDAHSVPMSRTATRNARTLTWRRKGPFTLLAPGDSIASLFGFGASLVGGDREPLKPFRVRVSYRWRAFWYWRVYEISDYHDMDVRPFQGIVPKWPKNETGATPGGAEILKKELSNITKAVEARPKPQIPDKAGDIENAVLLAPGGKLVRIWG